MKMLAEDADRGCEPKSLLSFVGTVTGVVSRTQLDTSRRSLKTVFCRRQSR